MPVLLIVGLLIIAGGLVLFVSWFSFFWILIKALTPLALLTLGGALTYFGWEERKDRKGALLDFSSPAEASRYQAEARLYQEKLNNFQGEDEEPGSPRDLEKTTGGAESAPEPAEAQEQNKE
ncbi:MAG: hypothetical protein LBT86_04545 [Deltaproteobacteria bacterium]|jgi:hypothetical protein|nr:hypothetical protein [Deltaproteobacteria bacterium]